MLYGVSAYLEGFAADLALVLGGAFVRPDVTLQAVFRFVGVAAQVAGVATVFSVDCGVQGEGDVGLEGFVAGLATDRFL